MFNHDIVFNLLTSWRVSAWDEIHEVFGDGHDYDWALVDDEEPGYEEQQVKLPRFAKSTNLLTAFDGIE